VALVGSGEEMFEADYSTTRLSQTSGKARRKHPIQGASVTTSASEMESIPPIDFAHLRRYTFGDEQLEREVLELFCIHAPGLLEEMKAATNPAAWREAAHSLKGSALAVGALHVARMAEEAEAVAPKYGEANAIVARLQDAIERVKTFWPSVLGPRELVSSACEQARQSYLHFHVLGACGGGTLEFSPTYVYQVAGLYR